MHCEERQRPLVFRYFYPRIDTNVTKQINHSLKIPFSLHPKTQRICLPIDVNHIDSFVPYDVPKLSQLWADLNEKDVTKRKHMKQFQTGQQLVIPPILFQSI